MALSRNFSHNFAQKRILPYQYRGSVSSAAGGSVITGTIDIGAADPNRLVIAIGFVSVSATFSSFTVNGVTMTQDKVLSGGTGSGFSYIIGSALVTSGTGPVTCTFTHSAGGFQNRSLHIFTTTALKNNVVSQTAVSQAAATTISVSAGDLLFSSGNKVGSGSTFGLSRKSGQLGDFELYYPGFGHTCSWKISNTNTALPMTTENLTAEDFILASYN